jgi:hypothetical protein
LETRLVTGNKAQALGALRTGVSEAFKAIRIVKYQTGLDVSI